MSILSMDSPPSKTSSTLQELFNDLAGKSVPQILKSIDVFSIFDWTICETPNGWCSISHLPGSPHAHAESEASDSTLWTTGARRNVMEWCTTMAWGRGSLSRSRTPMVELPPLVKTYSLQNCKKSLGRYLVAILNTLNLNEFARLLSQYVVT